jgi:transposase, IS30 family
MKYQHLSLSEREKLFCWNELGISLREIGKRLNRSDTTIGRELKRNKSGQGRRSHEHFNAQYLPCVAQAKALKRTVFQRSKAPLKEVAIFLYVREHLRKPFFWTPEQISGKLPLEHPGKSINTETIYQYIYSKKGRRFKLWELLTCARKKRMKKLGRTVQRSGKIPGSISIDLRPEAVANRSRVGDWETDNLGGKTTDQTALSVTVERLSRYTILTKLTNRLAVTKKDALIRRLGIFPQQARLTLTTDNGSENSQHQQISRGLELTMYFCHAYHSWEKGGVENMNKRIRRFIPKGTSIDQVSQKKIGQIEWILNHTPRKCLGYLTPQEKMVQLLNSSSA